MKGINIKFNYGKKEILHGCNFNFEKGKVIALVGPNGSGKSTLLKCCAKLLKIKSGTIELEQNNKTFAQTLSYLPQYKRTPDIKVLNMVLHGRFPYMSYPRHYKEIDYQIAKQSLKTLGIEQYSNYRLSECSGGTIQKVYLAMALTQQSDIILLDEPTTYLDITIQHQLMKLLKQLSNHNKCIVLILHDLSLALKYADELYLLKEGNIITHGKPNECIKEIEEVFDIHIKHVDNDYIIRGK